MADSPGGGTADIQHDRALRLFRFLQEFTQLKTRTVRDIEKYKREGQVLWFSDMPQENGCASPAWTSLGEGRDRVWLEVKKQTLPRPPAVPETLKPWVSETEISKSGGDEPKLKQVIYLPAEEDDENADEEGEDSQQDLRPLKEHRLVDYAGIPPRFEAYLEKWRPWSDEHARMSAVQHLYGRLFRAYQHQKRLGESFELIIGLGFLCWRTPVGQIVRRHAVVARAEMVFDSERGLISVRCPPPPDGASLQLESDYLEADERPDHTQFEIAEAHLEEIGDGIWERELCSQMLKSWAYAIHPDATFSDSLERQSAAGAVPSITFAPALIIRKRTTRGILALLKSIIDQIEAGQPLPTGVVKLTEHLDDEMPLHGDASTAREPDQVFFPLPSNDEQQRIVQQLSRRQGLLVQGPPGTGKSQTIANLICHLLANNKRILITSETARALKVLKDKIPDEVKPLCVSLLGADSAAFSELESSVNGISQRHARWQPDQYREWIQRAEKALDSTRRALARVRSQLRDMRESETHEKDCLDGVYRGTTSEIARRLNAEAEQFSWLQLSPKAPDVPTVTNAEGANYIRAIRAFPKEKLAELSLDSISLEGIPEPEAFIRHVNAERAAAKQAQQFESLRAHAAYKPILNAAPENRARIRKILNDFATAARQLSTRPEPWIEAAMRDVLAERESKWKVLADRTRDCLVPLELKARHADDTRVEWRTNHSEEKVLADARAVAEHLMSSGGSWGALGFLSKELRGRGYLAKEISVDGAPPKTPEALSRLILWIEVRLKIDDLWKAWQPHVERVEGILTAQVAELKEHLEALDIIFGLLDQTRDFKREAYLCEPRIPTPLWTFDSIEEHLQVSVVAQSAVDYKEACAATDRAASLITESAEKRNPHPAVAELCSALRNRDTAAWAAAYDKVKQLEQERRNYSSATGFTENLNDWTASVEISFGSTDDLDLWWKRLSKIEEAWRWAKASDWIQRQNNQDEYARLVEQERQYREKESKEVAELAAARAWNFFLSRLTQKETENLQAWRLAIKKIGKGTGKLAERHRRDAQKYMEECVNAIPAWILPRYRVADALKPKPGLFDVVIVDEASQTGIDGLFLYYLGKQMVVVGDDQQISPYDVGIKAADVEDLQRRLLGDLPFHTALLPTTSIYDHAVIRYPGKIVLKEHFRCMPEIIEFSNQLSYRPNDTPLVPLRQYPPKRLDPVVTRFIEEGYQEGSSNTARNRPEAEALVAQLAACIRDNRYAGKTFGVVSLVGESQSRLINDLLVAEIGPEEMESRELVCGSPYAFQGDERDIMFLSMVSAPNARVGTLSSQSAQQRFNVAVSRARDQLWLFHSIKHHDLSPNCMRRRLLEYCAAPEAAVAEASDLPFESDFERAVFNDITQRGYRVLTQVAAGDQFPHRFRIDLVVEGRAGRLAVECDGDQWHGPDRYEYDMARQRQLERAGWVFFRVKGSDYYLNSTRALEPLWRELEARGIEPMSAEAEDDSPPPEPIQLAPGTSESAIEEDDSDLDDDAAEVQAGPEHQAPDTPPEPVPEVVEIGDTVTYCFTDADDALKEVQVQQGQSNVDLGIIDAGTPIGRALVGCQAEEERTVPLPRGAKTIRVLAIRKRSPSQMPVHKPAVKTVPAPVPQPARREVPADSNEAPAPTPVRAAPEQTKASAVAPSSKRREEQMDMSFAKPWAIATADKSETERATFIPTSGSTPREEYQAWETRDLDDPNYSSTSEIAEWLEEIIQVEGPVLVNRVYQTYARAAGFKKVGRMLRKRFNSALYSLASKQAVILVDEHDDKATVNKIVRCRGTAQVRVRALGDRNFHEVPPSEVAEVLRKIRRSRPGMPVNEEQRRVLDFYGLTRLTEKVRTELDRISARFL